MERGRIVIGGGRLGVVRRHGIVSSDLIGVVEDGSEERTRPNEAGCGGNGWSLLKGYIGNGE